jgi:cytochrome c
MPGSCNCRKRDNWSEPPGGTPFAAASRRRGAVTGQKGGAERAPMSSFEWNKIIASVLTAMIVAMVTGIVAQSIVHPVRLEKPAYLPPGAEGGAAAGPTEAAAAAPAGPPPIQPFLEKADAKRGEQVAKVCLQCHTFGKGEPNKIGPNLFGVLDENIASVPGYTFSSALSADKDKKWNPDELNVWLYKPQEFAHGTKMTFAGLPKEQDRADVIAYLQTLK